MNIEEVAVENPSAVITTAVDIAEGLKDDKALSIAAAAGFADDGLMQAVETMKRLYELFIRYDATMIEINPMAEDRKGNGEVNVQVWPITVNTFSRYDRLINHKCIRPIIRPMISFKLLIMDVLKR